MVWGQPKTKFWVERGNQTEVERRRRLAQEVQEVNGWMGDTTAPSGKRTKLQVLVMKKGFWSPQRRHNQFFEDWLITIMK